MLENKLRFFIKGSIFISVLSFLWSLFFDKAHDWDVDAFLYLGSRLWHGELLYFNDFETKLPFVQYLFSLPSALGGIGAWRIMNFLICTILVYLGSLNLTKSFPRNYLSQTKLNLVKWLFFSLFFVLLYCSPGSMSAHIEMISSSLAYLSLAFTIRTFSEQTSKMFFLSGIFLALAASIRPNFVFVILANFIFIFKTNNKLLKDKNQNLYKHKIFHFFNFNIGFFSIILISVIPYFLFKDGISVLIDGLSAIAGFDSKANFTLFFYNQLKFFYLVMYLGCAIFLKDVILGKFSHDKFSKDLGLFSILCIFLINSSLLGTHYLGHNLILFIPYFVLLVLVILIRFTKDKSITQVNEKRRNFLKKTYFKSSIFFLATLAMVFLLKFNDRVTSQDYSPNFQINDRGVDHELLTYLMKKKSSFYVHFSPIYHSLLHESRIGDGHPVMLQYVMNGKRIGPIGNINLYSDEVFRSPCNSLLHSGKKIIRAPAVV